MVKSNQGLSKGLYFTIPQTEQPIHKVEIVGLIRKIFENTENAFRVITVDDGSGCMQCMCSGSAFHSASVDFSEEGFGNSLNALANSIQRPSPQVGHMIRARGILTLTKDSQDHMTKQMKVLEYGIEIDPDAFSDWILETSDVWNEIFCRKDQCGNALMEKKEIPTEITKKEFISLWTVIEHTTDSSTLSLNSLTKLCNEETLSAAHHQLCTMLQTNTELWNKFTSCLSEHGCILRKSSGEDIIVKRYDKFVKSVMTATRAERAMMSIVNKVRNTFRGHCTEKTVLCALDYLEQESLIYSFVNDKGQKMYDIV